MAFSAALAQTNFSTIPSTSSSNFTQDLRKFRSRFAVIRAVKSSSEPPQSAKASVEAAPGKEDSSSNAQPPKEGAASAPKTLPKKPVYSMKKGQIVRVDKEKYLNSINYLSVGHPPYYKGLDYIYQDRGEVLDMRVFETDCMGGSTHSASLASNRHAYQVR